MRKPEVLLDVDGVLCNFVEGFIKVVNDATGGNHTVDEITSWDIMTCLGKTKEEAEKIYETSHREGFCYSLKPYPGAKEGVAALKAIADIHVVTSPMKGKYWQGERTEWLVEHFGFKHNDVTNSSKKHKFRGDFLIDDKLETLEKWSPLNAYGYPILWSILHNQHDRITDPRIHRIAGWDNLLEFIRNHPHLGVSK